MWMKIQQEAFKNHNSMKLDFYFRGSLKQSRKGHVL